VPDLEVVTVTLLVPKINLSPTEPQSAFETQLIFTTHRTSIDTVQTARGARHSRTS
jgi:hypothetical protein